MSVAEISPVLRSVVSPKGVTGIAHWCPACDDSHEFALSGKNTSGAQWQWDGNVVWPTCSPSMNIRINTPDMVGYNASAGTSICHYFLRAGVIEYLGDCSHAMRNQKVPLPEWDRLRLRRLNYGWMKDA